MEAKNTIFTTSDRFNMAEAYRASRRVLVGHGAAGALFAMACSSAQAADTEVVSPSLRYRASRLLDADLQDGVASLWVGQGTVYAAPDPERPLLPLLGVVVVENRAAWTLAPHRYGLARKRLILFTGLDGQAPVLSFKNPFNGMVCRPFCVVERLTETVAPHEDKTAAASWRWELSGRQVTRTKTSLARRMNPLSPELWPHQSSGSVLTDGSMIRSSVDLAAVNLAPGPHHAPSHHSFEATPWYPWMLMGESHGNLVMDVCITAALDLGSIAPGLARHIERDHADVLRAPSAFESPVSDLYAEYARRHEPLRLTSNELHSPSNSAHGQI